MWDMHGIEYYEGYVIHKQLPLPILHAWNVKDGRVIDTTLKNPEEYEYMGIRFDEKTIMREQLKHEVYGLLDVGMINLELLREIDNELVEEGLALHTRRTQAEAGVATGVGAVVRKRRKSTGSKNRTV